ncbi:hypothetical protein [Mycobacteroides abscessus]|uniref:hypothetical protein n=1 Tax=Mycobacteroides abscessus TaxID=36809 RepID=UPI00266B4299|nr:hypothetical protein [Mycobacteroides abscessus]MDO3331379.1 hypothetical protein [Mycobacteroides abscessus subsp. abscessus]
MIRRLFSRRIPTPDPTPQTTTADPALEEHLRAVVRHALGPWAVAHPQWSQDGTLRRYQATFEPQFVNDLVSNPRLRRKTEKLLQDAIPAPDNGWWNLYWDMDNRTLTAKAAILPAHAVNPAPAHISADPLDEHLPPQLPCGVDEHGDPVIWPLDRIASALVVDGVGCSGTSTQIRTIITGAAKAAMCVVIANFSHRTDEFDGLRDWPNIHLVANGPKNALRAISYVHQIFANRQLTGQRGTPIMLVINGFDELNAILQSNHWNLSFDHPTCLIIERKLGQLRRLGLAAGVHLLVETGTVPPEIDIHNLAFKIQVGYLAGNVSYRLWEDLLLGQTVPPNTPGRALTHNEEGFHQFQGYYTPDPAAPDLTDEDTQILATLRPDHASHTRMVIDMPPTATEWDQIESAPIVPAATRPDLDPLSDLYRPDNDDPPAASPAR